MVALAADGLARMAAAHVPASLRRAASFAPAKRAKLAGGQIAASVESDADFRDHLATQIKAMVPDVVARLEAAEEIPDEALIESAAVAAIVRPDGWEGLIERAQAWEDERRTSPGSDLDAAVEKLTRDLDQARGETKAVRERLKSQLEQVKAENTGLRQKLGQTRADLADAKAATEAAGEALEAARREAEVAAREADAEARRLRTRISELETVTASSRRAARDERDAEVIRLRLLLETVMEASLGLRREMALPPSEGLPADSVFAIEPGSGSGVAGVGRALLQDDPALLRRLLELPKVHLIVDGYNVSKTAWPSCTLEQQRNRLVSGVAALVGGKGIETTIVFDGADLTNPPMVTSPKAIRVRFSAPGVIADDLIRQLVVAEPVGRPIVVVSTDREVAESVTKMGARSVAAIALVKAMS
jgi:predicted RNA-binding protein with PIN domain